MHASAFCGGIDATTMENITTRVAGPLTLVAGAIAGIVVPFRRATVEERKEMLQDQDLPGLRALCQALRVKTATSKAGRAALVESIEQTLAYDDAIYQPNSPAGKLAAFLARMPASNAATDEVVRNFKLKELKQFCRCLRLPLSGKKSDLARSLVDEMRYTLAAISASTVQEEDVPQAAGAGTSAVAAAAQAAASAPALAPATASEEVGMAQELEITASVQLRGASLGSCRSRQSDSNGEKSDRMALELNGAKAEVSEPSVIDVQVTPAEWPAMAATRNPAEHTTPSSSGGATCVAQQARSGFKVMEDIAESDAGTATSSQRVRATPVGGELQSGVVHTQAIPKADSWREERRRRRRVRWEMQKMSYVAEELASAYGGHKENYIRDMRGILDEVPEQTYATNVDDLSDMSNGQQLSSLPSGEAANPPLEQMVMLGEVGRSRKAWCKWWDNLKGNGELLDIDDQNTVAVASVDLQIAVNVLDRLKYLVPGEIVEYRRVEVEGMTTRAVLVRGMHGWPLRCEMDCLA